MRLPGYTAAAALYDSKYHYVARGDARPGSAMLSRITTAQSIWIDPTSQCQTAQSLCIENSQGSGYDPSGWCDFYERYCIVAPPPPSGPGGSGGFCPACIDHIVNGCCCDVDGNCCCKGTARQ
jgi:hypothetical protein